MSFSWTRVTRAIILFLILLASGCLDDAGNGIKAADRPPVEVDAHVDEPVATIGDEITYAVTMDYKPAAKLTISEFGAEIVGFRIVDIGESGPREIEGRLRLIKWYRLKADLVGSYILPSFTIHYEYQDEQGECSTGQIFVEVESVLDKVGNSTDIRDIKPLAPIQQEIKTIMLLCAIAGVALCLAVTGTIVYFKNKRTCDKAPLLRPPHELALGAIQRLQNKKLIEQGRVRVHYFELAEIFRQYLEDRFSFPAVEETTEEIIPELLQLEEVDEIGQSLAKQFLINTDWVKFAKHSPSLEEIERDHRLAIRFIEQTAMQEPLNSEE